MERCDLRDSPINSYRILVVSKLNYYEIINESILFKELLESITQKYKIMFTTNIRNILLKEESTLRRGPDFSAVHPKEIL